MIIHLPDEISRRLESQANARHVSTDQLAADLLARALQRAETQSAQDELFRVVEEIKDTPPDLNHPRPATASLLDLLSAPAEPVEDEEPPLSPEEWDREWANFEAQEKTLARSNDIVEDRS